MNEKGLIEQVLRIINANYTNIYVIDIPEDKVYSFGFNVANTLVIKETTSYTDFIELASNFVHKDELNSYFEAISLNKLESEAQKGNNETKVKYRKLCEAGEYRWFVNIINYLPLDGKRLIFMMSEDINERLVDSEEDTIRLNSTISQYQKKLSQESESISDAIIQINTLLENQASTSNGVHMRDPRMTINSIFNRVSVDHPELNKAILEKMATIANYRKPSILIVDDSSIIRNSLKRIFSNEFNIIMAKDGSEAIEIIKENVLNHDLLSEKENIVGILLDLIMPNKDGFDVLDFLNDKCLLNRIPVAIISGDETKETRKRVYNYDIVDMLEKPFNTDNIRRRISKIINLYISSNNLQNIVDVQSEKLEVQHDKNFENLKTIIAQIAENVLHSKESTRLKKMVRIVSIALADKYSKYNLTPNYIDSIVNGCALYNIGAIAMSDDMVITSQTIRQEIEYGLSIIDYILADKPEKAVTENIIKYSCEMYDGTGYPNNIKGSDIPIEAQITNLMVRLNQAPNMKTFNQVLKQITTNEQNKYNPELLEIIELVKKDIKNI